MNLHSWNNKTLIWSLLMYTDSYHLYLNLPRLVQIQAWYSSVYVYCLLMYNIFVFDIQKLFHSLSLYSIRNDSSDPSDSTMKKTPRVRHTFHSRKSEEYTLDLDRSYSRCFFHSRVTSRVTRITRVVANLCESNTTLILHIYRAMKHPL